MSRITGFALYTFYSIQHVQAAAYHARRAKRLERRYDGNLTSPLGVGLLADAVAGLFAAVAFLEATVNELFAETAFSDGGQLRQLGLEARRQIEAIWSTRSVERAPLLVKADKLLNGAGKLAFDDTSELYMAVQLMVILRNRLVHYNASWLDVGTEELIRPGSLAESSLAESVSNSFPPRAHTRPGESDAFIGYGLARWAVQSALGYADELYARLGILPIYDHVRVNLSPD